MPHKTSGDKAGFNYGTGHYHDCPHSFTSRPCLLCGGGGATAATASAICRHRFGGSFAFLFQILKTLSKVPSAEGLGYRFVYF